MTLDSATAWAKAAKGRAKVSSGARQTVSVIVINANTYISLTRNSYAGAISSQLLTGHSDTIKGRMEPPLLGKTNAHRETGDAAHFKPNGHWGLCT